MQIKDKPNGECTNSQEDSLLEIHGYDEMPPFFMSLISRDNLWAFISSRGSLTAGRESAEKSIFPYVTVDKIHDSYGTTGPRTMIRIQDNKLWEPFTPHTVKEPDIERNLSKGVLGNSICFEEMRVRDGLSFKYLSLIHI